MSEMVERVARALCPGDPDEMTPEMVRREIDGRVTCTFDGPMVPVWTFFVGQARTAIEAMREPTEAMDNASGHENTHSDVWRAMVGEALK